MSQTKDAARLLIAITGWTMLAFAAIGAGSEIDKACDGASKDPGLGVAMVTIFTGGGLLLLRKHRRMKSAGVPPSELASPEQRVLAAARRNRGRLTAVSVAAEGSLTVEQAQQELERLAKANACLMDVSGEGLVVFRFPEFEDAANKSSA